MSNIGNKTIRIPNNLNIIIEKNQIVLGNANATIKKPIPENIKISCIVVDGIKNIKLETADLNNPMYGTFRNLLNNDVKGLSRGYSVTLNLIGVGYQAEINNSSELLLKIGYSQKISIKVPSDLKVFLPKRNIIVITGINLEKIKQFASNIRAFKKPNAYKVKGVLFKKEKYKLKEGKKK